MIINKDFAMGSLQVDSQSGKIWINSLSSCLLRIQNVNFHNLEDKFAMLDITGSDVYMVPGDFGMDETYNDFIKKLTLYLFPVLVESKGRDEEFLADLLKNINDYIKEYHHGCNS